MQRERGCSLSPGLREQELMQIYNSSWPDWSTPSSCSESPFSSTCCSSSFSSSEVLFSLLSLLEPPSVLLVLAGFSALGLGIRSSLATWPATMQLLWDHYLPFLAVLQLWIALGIYDSNSSKIKQAEKFHCYYGTCSLIFSVLAKTSSDVNAGSTSPGVLHSSLLSISKLWHPLLHSRANRTNINGRLEHGLYVCCLSSTVSNHPWTVFNCVCTCIHFLSLDLASNQGHL